MNDKYVVVNRSNGPVSIRIFLPTSHDELMAMPSHRRRRAMQSSVANLVVPIGGSIDIIAKTGMTVDQIKSCSDLIKLERSGRLLSKIEISEPEKILVQAPVQAPAPKVEPEPEPKEEVEPESEEEPVDKIGEKESVVVRRSKKYRK